VEERPEERRYRVLPRKSALSLRSERKRHVMALALDPSTHAQTTFLSEIALST